MTFRLRGSPRRVSLGEALSIDPERLEPGSSLDFPNLNLMRQEREDDSSDSSFQPISFSPIRLNPCVTCSSKIIDSYACDSCEYK